MAVDFVMRILIVGARRAVVRMSRNRSGRPDFHDMVEPPLRKTSTAEQQSAVGAF